MAATLQRATAFRPSAQFEARYELGHLLGKGGFGSVYACVDKSSGKQVACKVLDREYVRRTLGVEASKEVGIMQQLANQHYGVIQLLDSFEDEVHSYAVMEYCSGRSLLDVLKAHGAMPEKSAKVVLGQVAAALAFCHSKRILHLDIKPENIFFSEDPTEGLYGADFPGLSLSSLFSTLDVRARLADFGMATVLKPGKKVRGDVGSPHFKAPEIVGGLKFGLEVDVWSLGVVLCVMLTGTVPFLGTTNHDQEGLNQAILKGRVDLNSARWWKVSAEAKDLVTRMLTVDPAKRITAAEVLEHPWFKSAETALEEEILPEFARENASAPFVPAGVKGKAVATVQKCAPGVTAVAKLPSARPAAARKVYSICKQMSLAPRVQMPQLARLSGL